MGHKIVEKRPGENAVFLVKYTFDNIEWNQFFSEVIHESGSGLTFFGCRVKFPYANSNGDLVAAASRLPDVQLDGNMARVLALVVRKPEWFDTFQPADDAPIQISDPVISPLNLPGMSEYS